MEMTRKSLVSSSTATATEEEASSLLRPAASPFSPETERRHLERAFLPPPPSSSSSSSATERHEPLCVPTAVPIPISDKDELARNSESPVAVARPIPATTTTAAAITASSSSSSSSRAATTSPIEEKNKTNKTEHDSEILVQPSPPTHHLPTTTIATLTHPLPTRAQSTTSRELLRRAQLRGTLSSESEKEDIRRAQRERNAVRYHAARAVEAANEAAARRERGGWTSFGEEERRGRVGELDGGEERNKEEREEEERRFGTILPNGERGYEVAEYHIGEDYEVQEYDVAEYKSVYE